MDNSINITLPEGYTAPTEQEISKAKKWTLLRNENAAHLSSLIEDLLQDAARELTKIGYKYNVKPEDFEFSADKNLREEVAAVMNGLEDEIFALVEDYSLNGTEDKKRRNKILPWLLALHAKGTKNLGETLHQRLTQFLFDTEAQIAAMKLAKYKQTKAIERVLSTMHTVYTSPEMLAAFRKKSAARYVQSRGVHKGNVGLSGSGAVNIENFGNMTARMTWSQLQYEEAKEKGKDGYFCFRGSTYPCSLCDDVCSVFHLMEEGMVLPVHGHCCCYAVFVGMEDAMMSSRGKNIQQEYQRYKNDKNYNDVKFNPENGGLKATHKWHNFDKKGGVYERHVQNAGFNAGHAVILENERGGAFNSKFTEGTWDGKKFEVAGCETATSNNILHGLSHCASKGGTKVAVIDFPNGGFNQDTWERTIGRYKGLEKLDTEQYLRFERIVCVQNEKIIIDMPFP